VAKKLNKSINKCFIGGLNDKNISLRCGLSFTHTQKTVLITENNYF